VSLLQIAVHFSLPLHYVGQVTRGNGGRPCGEACKCVRRMPDIRELLAPSAISCCPEGHRYETKAYRGFRGLIQRRPNRRFAGDLL